MKLTFSYANLLADLQTVASILSDAGTNDDIKNIIFRVKEDNKVEMIGITPVLGYRKTCSTEEVTVLKEEGDSEFISVKIKELIDFLNTYKSLRRTTVEEVSLEVVRDKVKCTVVEKLISDDEFEEPHTTFSCWMFSLITVKPNMMPYINLEVPEDIHNIHISNFSIHTKQLSNILQPGTNAFSKLFFSKDYVFAQSNAFTSFMRNQTTSETDVFTDISLSYRTVNFIEKVASSTTSEDTVGVAKTPERIFIVTNNDEVIYTTYDNRIIPFTAYTDAFKKENCVIVNRFSLREAIKRFMLKNDSISVVIKPAEGVIEMKNSLFSQDIEITNKKGFEGVEEIKLSVMPAILNNGIICDDICEQVGTEDLCLYYCMSAKNIPILCISDLLKYEDSNLWFTYMNTKFN